MPDIFRPPDDTEFRTKRQDDDVKRRSNARVADAELSSEHDGRRLPRRGEPGRPDSEAAAQSAASASSAEDALHWRLIGTPLGEEWSGRTRYAAAMHLYRTGEMSAEVLEVYRMCSRLDHEDPLPIIRDRSMDAQWERKLRRRLNKTTETVGEGCQ